jgi:hypothetical protein
MFSASVCAFFCVCVQVEALRRADHPPKESYRLSNKIEKKTEVKRRVSWRLAKAHWGCSAKEKKLNFSMSSLVLAATYCDTEDESNHTLGKEQSLIIRVLYIFV